ncbi:tetratricopeptide (TPR) repeat protein [Loktanella ponticola]|uniref:Tetratricopeptide (TPR) repeat protein n=1 Tax=Yoonia ponticola TaxID=1524255 RepID=A0A7W9EYS2_9RHOB|nr:tetratricopeptide (TPR) repeat protein [Yoonia ponticola]
MFLQKQRGAIIIALMLNSTAATAQDSVPNAGAYLAARQAAQTSDFEYGVKYYTESLRTDPANGVLLENALTATMSLGRFDDAVALAKTIDDIGINRQHSNIVLAVNAAKTDNWANIFAALEMDRRVGPVVDGLSQGWAHMALGEFDKALVSFDEVTDTTGLQSFGTYHKALALASVGNYDEAVRIFDLAAETDGLRHNRRSAMAHAQILSQLDRRDDALALIDEVFGETLDPRLVDLRDRIESGAPTPYDIITNPTEGLAEVYLSVAEALRPDVPENYTLIYARAAEYLAPDNTEVLLQVASLLEDLERYGLANETYTRVSRDDPAYAVAEIGRAEALRKKGNFEGATEVLRAMTRTFPDMPAVYVSLGDTLRQSEQIQEANAAYSTALDLYPADDPARWFVHYIRAVTYHALDQWPEAEADFRAALSFRPDQPRVLNYLGYSLVERGEKLDEALGMIEKAVSIQPQNGAIVDSLGWVLFQLGDYETAVGHLEDAAALEAVDPVVNDHLGDCYWAVGRKVEARFQWNRALSFSDEDSEDAARIRRKLEIGLDAVLIEEGEEPIKVAHGVN